jgi:hypothetical protein
MQASGRTVPSKVSGWLSEKAWNGSCSISVALLTEGCDGCRWLAEGFNVCDLESSR